MTSAINASTHPLTAENETLSITKENDYHPYDPHQHHHGIMTSTEEDQDEMTIEEDGNSSMSSSPSIPDENINFDLVYALHTFTATVEGQASVVKGDALILMEDTNIYWWLVEVLKTREIGYIPAENIETPYERLARLNKHRNVEITSPSPDTTTTTLASSEYTSFTTSSSKRVTIAADGSLEKSMFMKWNPTLKATMNSVLAVATTTTITSKILNNKISPPRLENTNNLSPRILLPNFLSILMTTILSFNWSMNSKCKFIKSISNKTYLMDSSSSNNNNNNNNNKSSKGKSHSNTLHLPPGNGIHLHSLSSDGSSKHHSLETHSLRVFAGNIGQGPLFHSFDILAMTTTDDLLKEVVKRFDILPTSSDDQNSTIEYYIAVQGADGDDYILASQDKPLSIFKTLTASLTTPMPAVSQNICRKPQEGTGSTRRKRSSSFGNYEQTSYEEDSVIRFYVHRRMKRAHERQGLVYIKVSLYPDDPSSNDHQVGFLEQQQQQQQPSSTFFFKNKKKKLSAAAIKTEIDRIDKILPVSYDSLVGAVINTALEKFHVPDAEADGMQHQQDQKSHPLDVPPPQSHRHGTTKYYMSVRNASGQEILLQPTDIMEDVLHGQQQQVSDHISRDLLFILRQCNLSGRKTRQQPPFPLSNLGKQDRKSSYSSVGSYAGGGGSEERRPSILDILMDSPPRSADDRRPSYKSSPLASPRSFINDRRRSNHSLGQQPQQPHQQDRSNSLPSVYEATSPLASTHGLSPPVMSISRSRQSSCSALSTNPPSSDQSDTDRLAFSSSSSSLTNSKHENGSSTNSGSDTKKRKEGSSFKSQLKRLVGWGSSSSPKLKKVNDLTISTSPSVQSSTITSIHQQQQQQHQQQTITSQSAFVSTGSNFSFSKADGLQSNISTTSAPAISGAAMSSSTSLPQQVSEPLPQQQQHLQHPMDDGRSASLYMNSNSSTPSVQSSSSPAGQWQHVDSVMMVHDASSRTNNSQQQQQQQDLPPPPVPPKTQNDSHVAHLAATTMSSNNSELVVSRSSSIIQHNDHNDDDDMISSSSSSDDDYDEPDTQGDSNDSDDGVAIVGAVDSDDDDEDDESDDPDRPEQRRRLNSVVSIGRGAGAKNASSSSRKGSLAGMTISEHHRNDNNYEAQQQQQQQPTPAPVSTPAQDDFDNDLFFW
ncbi:unnamed protein product [Absidia cylindrospora]